MPPRSRRLMWSVSSRTIMRRPHHPSDAVIRGIRVQAASPLHTLHYWQTNRRFFPTREAFAVLYLSPIVVSIARVLFLRWSGALPVFPLPSRFPPSVQP